jgi:hypothetical protein
VITIWFERAGLIGGSVIFETIFAIRHGSIVHGGDGPGLSSGDG